MIFNDYESKLNDEFNKLLSEPITFGEIDPKEIDIALAYFGHTKPDQTKEWTTEKIEADALALTVKIIKKNRSRYKNGR